MLSGAIGLFKSIPVVHACGADYDGPAYYPVDNLTDFSQGPLTDYLVKYYGSKLSIKHDSTLTIRTKEKSENSMREPLEIEIPAVFLEKEFINIECSHIDVFSQIMDGPIEGPVYRIASYTFKNNALPNIGMWYRRQFTYSRVVAVATLIDKKTKEITGIIYNYTTTLKGGNPCYIVLPGY